MICLARRSNESKSDIECYLFPLTTELIAWERKSLSKIAQSRTHFSCRCRRDDFEDMGVCREGASLTDLARLAPPPSRP